MLCILFLILSSVVLSDSSLTEPEGVPVGTIVLFGGDRAPDQWLFCNGSVVSRTTYSSLFKVIGVLYGSGDDIRTFKLPDFRGRFPLGFDMSTMPNGMLTNGGSTTVTLTEAELPPHQHDTGSLSTLAAGHHSHSYNDPGHNHGGLTGEGPFSRAGNAMIPHGGVGNDHGGHHHSIHRDYTRIHIHDAGIHSHKIIGRTGTTGTGRPFSIMPPYQAINYIIHAGPSMSSNQS